MANMLLSGLGSTEISRKFQFLKLQILTVHFLSKGHCSAMCPTTNKIIRDTWQNNDP